MCYTSREPSNRFKALQLVNLLLELPALSAFRCFSQLSFNGGDEMLQIRLHQVVLRSELQRGHRDLFTDGAGNKDKRHVRVFLPYELQSIRSSEVRHGVVGNDDVPPVLEG